MFNKIKGVLAGCAGAVALVALTASVSMAIYTPIFAVDTATLGNVTGDLTAWGAALIAVSLALLAFRYVRRILGR